MRSPPVIATRRTSRAGRRTARSAGRRRPRSGCRRSSRRCGREAVPAEMGMSRRGRRLDPQRGEGHEPRCDSPCERDDPGCERHPPPPQPGHHVEHAGHEWDEAWPSSPRRATPASPCPKEQHGLAPPLDRRGAVELVDDVRHRGPTRPSCPASSSGRGWSPAAPGVIVTAGTPRAMSGPCSWCVWHAVPGELVVGAGCPAGCRTTWIRSRAAE